MQPLLSWRTARLEDLVACLAVRPEKNGAETVGSGPAKRAWSHMFQLTHAARGAVVELNYGRKTEVVGFGFAVFVPRKVTETELSHPRPGLNSRLIFSILDGHDPVLSFADVRASNTKGDLQQIILHASWKDNALTANQREEVRVLLAVAYAHTFAGYRISTVLTEAVDSLDESHIKGHRSFLIVDRFKKFFETNPDSKWNRDRALALASQESIQMDPGSIAATLFQHSRIPQFGFARVEQELLEVALDGLDDTAASERLFVTLPAIKRRWANIFARVGTSMPQLCPSDTSQTRGAQKRSRILTYLRNHPEELRPFDISKLER